MDGGRRKSQSVKPAQRRRAEPRLEITNPVPVLSTHGMIPPPTMRRRASPIKRKNSLPRFLGTYLMLGYGALIACIGLQMGGQLDLWRAQQGTLHDFAARLSGFGIERVVMTGHGQLTEREVLTAAGITPKSSLLFLDAEAARQRLETVPLIKTASIRKLYPDGLAIALTERDAYALWQKEGELFVISADGAVIDTMRDGRFIGLPHVVGEGANTRTRDYLELLEQAGPLKARILAGTLVSGRRWTLKLDNGTDVRLPEHNALAAVRRLVMLEKNDHILSRDVIAIDLRIADRVVVRLTEEAASARVDIMRKRPTRGKGVDT
jgi:cell division protein FtsQ